jgi:SSS family solute:Na+ symporter
MFFAITGTIWLGGSGAVIIGGLYWKKGTTAGAYGAVIIGMVVALIGFVLPRIWPTLYGTDFPINSQWMWFIAMVSASLSYIVISLLTFKSDFNLDKMLHRGKYAVEVAAIDDKPVRGLKALLGIDSSFTFKDKILYCGVTGFTVAMAAVFVAGTIYNLIFTVSAESWTQFWYFYVWLALILNIVTTIWFTWGAFINLRRMYQMLKTLVRDDTDDGRVDNAPTE